jgi:integrase
VEQRLAAIRHLFAGLTGTTWPVTNQIEVSTHAGLRERALIGLMVYSFARIGAALGMTVEDVYTQNRRLWVRLREKGGKRHSMPCHHNLEEIPDSVSRRCRPAR